MTASRSMLAEGRWHWRHGPIDIVAAADGDPQAVALAHEAAWRRFQALLGELVLELPLLRQPVGAHCPLRGPVARRMWQACAPFRAGFITPMAAVAGAVAQELVGFFDRPGIARAWINNGGDIALHLAPGQSVQVGLFADLARFDLRDVDRITVDGQFEVTSSMPVRGLATSGWRGRSSSRGIADSVTVLAATAAQADAGATVIANAVDVHHNGVHRRPASECKDDSDLGDLPVTVGVDPLPAAQVQRALDAGVAVARVLQQAGHIASAVLVCQGRYRTVDALCCDARPSIAVPVPRDVGSVLA